MKPFRFLCAILLTLVLAGGAGAIVCAAAGTVLVVHGVDNVQTGWNAFIYGEDGELLSSQTIRLIGQQYDVSPAAIDTLVTVNEIGFLQVLAAGAIARSARTGLGLGGANRVFDFSIVGQVSIQRQYRHIKDRPEWITGGQGGYFYSVDDAQSVLAAFRSGQAHVIGTTSSGSPVVRYSGVTGFNNNPGAGFVNQPTNVFIIKGTKRPSVVPTNPNWGQ